MGSRRGKEGLLLAVLSFKIPLLFSLYCFQKYGILKRRGKVFYKNTYEKYVLMKKLIFSLLLCH